MLLYHNVSISICLTVVIALYPCIYRGGASSGHRTPQLPPLILISFAACFISIVELKSAAERSLANAITDLSNPNRTPHAASEDTEKEHGFFWADFSCRTKRSRPKYRTKRAKPRRFTEVIHEVSVFINCPTVSPTGCPLNPLHFLHAPSHTFFHVRNLSVCLCLSCALHT